MQVFVNQHWFYINNRILVSCLHRLLEAHTWFLLLWLKHQNLYWWRVSKLIHSCFKRIKKTWSSDIWSCLILDKLRTTPLKFYQVGKAARKYLDIWALIFLCDSMTMISSNKSISWKFLRQRIFFWLTAFWQCWQCRHILTFNNSADKYPTSLPPFY